MINNSTKQNSQKQEKELITIRQNSITIQSQNIFPINFLTEDSKSEKQASLNNDYSSKNTINQSINKSQEINYQFEQPSFFRSEIVKNIREDPESRVNKNSSENNFNSEYSNKKIKQANSNNFDVSLNQNNHYKQEINTNAVKITCMKIDNLDKNYPSYDLNSAFLTKNKEMELDPIFQDLLSKVTKEKKEIENTHRKYFDNRKFNEILICNHYFNKASIYNNCIVLSTKGIDSHYKPSPISDQNFDNNSNNNSNSSLQNCKHNNFYPRENILSNCINKNYENRGQEITIETSNDNERDLIKGESSNDIKRNIKSLTMSINNKYNQNLLNDYSTKENISQNKNLVTLISKKNNQDLIKNEKSLEKDKINVDNMTNNLIFDNNNNNNRIGEINTLTVIDINNSQQIENKNLEGVKIEKERSRTPLNFSNKTPNYLLNSNFSKDSDSTNQIYQNDLNRKDKVTSGQLKFISHNKLLKINNNSIIKHNNYFNKTSINNTENIENILKNKNSNVNDINKCQKQNIDIWKEDFKSYTNREIQQFELNVLKAEDSDAEKSLQMMPQQSSNKETKIMNFDSKNPPKDINSIKYEQNLSPIKDKLNKANKGNTISKLDDCDNIERNDLIIKKQNSKQSNKNTKKVMNKSCLNNENISNKSDFPKNSNDNTNITLNTINHAITTTNNKGSKSRCKGKKVNNKLESEKIYDYNLLLSENEKPQKNTIHFDINNATNEEFSNTQFKSSAHNKNFKNNLNINKNNPNNFQHFNNINQEQSDYLKRKRKNETESDNKDLSSLTSSDNRIKISSDSKQGKKDLISPKQNSEDLYIMRDDKNEESNNTENKSTLLIDSNTESNSLLNSANNKVTFNFKQFKSKINSNNQLLNWGLKNFEKVADKINNSTFDKQIPLNLCERIDQKFNAIETPEKKNNKFKNLHMSNSIKTNNFNIPSNTNLFFSKNYRNNNSNSNLSENSKKLLIKDNNDSLNKSSISSQNLNIKQEVGFVKIPSPIIGNISKLPNTNKNNSNINNSSLNINNSSNCNNINNDNSKYNVNSSVNVNVNVLSFNGYIGNYSNENIISTSIATEENQGINISNATTIGKANNINNINIPKNNNLKITNHESNNNKKTDLNVKIISPSNNNNINNINTNNTNPNPAGNSKIFGLNTNSNIMSQNNNLCKIPSGNFAFSNSYYSNTNTTNIRTSNLGNENLINNTKNILNNGNSLNTINNSFDNNISTNNSEIGKLNLNNEQSKSTVNLAYPNIKNPKLNLNNTNESNTIEVYNFNKKPNLDHGDNLSSKEDPRFDVTHLKKLLKQKKIIFQETHREIDYSLKFNLEIKDSIIEITINSDTDEILGFSWFDNREKEKVIDIKNSNNKHTIENIYYNIEKIIRIIQE